MFEKWKIAFARDITMANWSERIKELYGEDNVQAYLDKPLEYHVLTTDTITVKKSLGFVNRVSNVLAEKLNTKKGDRIAVCMSNNMDLALIIHGIMKIGRIAVPLNFMLKGREIGYIVDNAGAEVFIADREVFNTNIKDKSRLPNIKTWIMAGPEKDVLPGFISLDKLLTEVSDELSAPALGKDDVVGIFYTSGTTGFPKGAMVTSRSLLSCPKIIAALLPVKKGDVGVLSLPIAHLFGFAIQFFGIFAGSCGYMLPHFDPKRVFEIIEKHKCTVFVGVPAMYTMMLLSNPEKYDLSSLRVWASSTDAMPIEHIRAITKLGTFAKIGPLKISSLFTEAYGMVELSGAGTFKPAIPGVTYKKGCVGFPAFPNRIKVVDDNGKKLKSGEIGEIVVKGPGVCVGYWNNEEATKNGFTADGWFRTGDMGRKSRLGLVYFADRKKDVVKCGGYSIFSVEVEKEMLAHPKIGEAAIFGVPHPTKGQMPVACVILKAGCSATPEELLAWCKENIAAYKVPRDIKILSQKDVPYTITLKIMKKELRERYSKEYV